MPDKATVKEIALRYADEVRKTLNPKSIILFGSHINGTPHEYSDIDIAVIFNDYQGNWLETAALLFNLTWDISIDIEPHMMDETCNRSGFLDYIRKTGEVIFEA